MARKRRKNKQALEEVIVPKYQVGIYARLSYKEKNESIAHQVDLAKGLCGKA